MRVVLILAVLVSALTTSSCTSRTEYEPGAPRLSAFEVTLERPDAAGTAEAPRPFPSAQPATTTLLVRAVDQYGELYTGDDAAMRISVEPGELISEPRWSMIDGERRIEVRYRFSYDQTRIWIEDVGEDPLTDCDDGIDNDGDTAIDLLDPDCLGTQPLVGQGECPDVLPDLGPGIEFECGGALSHTATQAVGISPPLYYARPRIRDVQFSPRCTTDTPLTGQNVTVETGTLIVTGTTQSGMYVTDLTGPEGGYNSIYLFTFSNPGDVRRGDRLCSIAGNAAEFIANTQLNFPSFVNADRNRNGRIDEFDQLPCDLPAPERIGPEQVPAPVVLTAKHFEDDVEDFPVPEEFYRFCGPDGAELPGIDGSSCSAARSLAGRDGIIDCRRDNFAVEPFEHGLVAIEDAVISTRFERCDINGDGRIQRDGGAEDACEDDCTEDPLCTVLLSLESFGQFSVGLGCTGTGETAECEAKAFVSTRDTLGGTGYAAMDNAGRGYARIVGHLRQLQPGAGVPTSWIIEPRFEGDFIPRGDN